MIHGGCEMSEELYQTLRSRLEEKPDSLVFARLAEILFASNKKDAAFVLLEKGIEQNPNYITGYVVLANLLRASGDSERAKATYRKVLEIDPFNIAALSNLAQIEFEAGNNANAAIHLLQILSIDPLNKSAFDMLAQNWKTIEKELPNLTEEPREEPPAIVVETVGEGVFSLIGIEPAIEVKKLPVVAKKSAVELTVLEHIVESPPMEPVELSEVEAETEDFVELDDIFKAFEPPKPVVPEEVAESQETSEKEIAIEAEYLPETFEDEAKVVGLEETLTEETEKPPEIEVGEAPVTTDIAQPLPQPQAETDEEIEPSLDWGLDEAEAKEQVVSAPPVEATTVEEQTEQLKADEIVLDLEGDIFDFGESDEESDEDKATLETDEKASELTPPQPTSSATAGQPENEQFEKESEPSEIAVEEGTLTTGEPAQMPTPKPEEVQQKQLEQITVSDEPFAERETSEVPAESVAIDQESGIDVPEIPAVKSQVSEPDATAISGESEGEQAEIEIPQEIFKADETAEETVMDITSEQFTEPVQPLQVVEGEMPNGTIEIPEQIFSPDKSPEPSIDLTTQRPVPEKPAETVHKELEPPPTPEVNIAEKDEKTFSTGALTFEEKENIEISQPNEIEEGEEADDDIELEQILGLQVRKDDGITAPDEVEKLPGIETRESFVPPSDVDTSIEGLQLRPDEPLAEIPVDELEALIGKPTGEEKSVVDETDAQGGETTTTAEPSGEQTAPSVPPKTPPQAPPKDVATATTAEIFAAQGMAEKAIEIYQTLLTRQDISDEDKEKFVARINFLKRRLSAKK